MVETCLSCIFGLFHSHRFVVLDSLRHELEEIKEGDRLHGLTPRIEIAVRDENQQLVLAGRVNVCSCVETLPKVRAQAIACPDRKQLNAHTTHLQTSFCVANVHTYAAAVHLGEACILIQGHASIPDGH